MKFGVRQIANVTFRATQSTRIGNKEFAKGQPVFYLDTAKTSSMEGAATSVYATGGRGNTRLISWEGEKTLTFTVEDALLSPVSFAMLSGAGVVKGSSDEYVHFHQVTMAAADNDGNIDLSNAMEPNERIDDTAPFFVLKVDDGGDLTGDIIKGDFVLLKDPTDDSVNGKKITYSGDSSARQSYAAAVTSGGNGGKDAFKFPYIINERHTATTEEIDGWTKESITLPTTLTTSPLVYQAVLAEPIPASYEFEGTTYNIVTTTKKYNDTATYIIEDSILQVTNADTNEMVTLSLPSALRQPTFTGTELNKIFGSGFTANSTYKVSNSYMAESAESENKKSNWTTVSESGVGGFPTAFFTKIRFNGSPYLSDGVFVTFDLTTGGGASITKTLTIELRNLIFQKYFDLGTENADRDAIRASFDKAYTNTLAEAAYQDVINTGTFMVDYYVVKPSASVTELQIDAENFGGYYYVEADTLFRRQSDGKDLPANLTFPNVKIQSNFTFSMASTGDPSTFSFTMDAFPGYTYFDRTKKVLCAIQIVDDKTNRSASRKTIFPHKTNVDLDVSRQDSSPYIYDEYEHGSFIDDE